MVQNGVQNWRSVKPISGWFTYEFSESLIFMQDRGPPHHQAQIHDWLKFTKKVLKLIMEISVLTLLLFLINLFMNLVSNKFSVKFQEKKNLAFDQKIKSFAQNKMFGIFGLFCILFFTLTWCLYFLKKIFLFKIEGTQLHIFFKLYISFSQFFI